MAKDYFGKEIEVGDIVAHTNTSRGNGNDVYLIIGFSPSRARCVWISKDGTVKTGPRSYTIEPNSFNTIILSKGHNPGAKKLVLNSNGTWTEETVES